MLNSDKAQQSNSSKDAYKGGSLIGGSLDEESELMNSAEEDEEDQDQNEEELEMLRPQIILD